jgi:hydroxyacylglutathione hydrolase
VESGIKTKKIDDCVWLLDDNGESMGYLICGEKKAVVIDTMTGVDDVHEVVREITNLPLTVVNTHGHCDHIYGNVYFDCECFLHPADMKIAEEHSQFPDFVKLCSEKKLKMPPFKAISDGDIIDLGGLTLEVISLPGHTPGGICLLLREKRILFVGDGINRHLWMQLKESLPLKTFLENLDKISWVTEKADKILHGHSQAFEDISLFDDLRSGIRNLIEAYRKGDTRLITEYIWFDGIAKQYPFGGESIICFTDDKLE